MDTKKLAKPISGRMLPTDYKLVANNKSRAQIRNQIRKLKLHVEKLILK